MDRKLKSRAREERLLSRKIHKKLISLIMEKENIIVGGNLIILMHKTRIKKLNNYKNLKNSQASTM